MPGDTLEIRDAQVYIDGKPLENPEDMQLNYLVQTTGPYITEDMFRELGISKDDQAMVTNESRMVLAERLSDNDDDAGRAERATLYFDRFERAEQLLCVFGGELMPKPEERCVKPFNTMLRNVLS